MGVKAAGLVGGSASTEERGHFVKSRRNRTKRGDLFGQFGGSGAGSGGAESKGIPNAGSWGVKARGGGAEGGLGKRNAEGPSRSSWS